MCSSQPHVKAAKEVFQSSHQEGVTNAEVIGMKVYQKENGKREEDGKH